MCPFKSSCFDYLGGRVIFVWGTFKMLIGHLCVAVSFVHFAIGLSPLPRVFNVWRLDY